MAKKLYVGNLPFNTSDTDLRDLFDGLGAIDTMTLVRDPQTGQPRGFAFVEMTNDADADQAIGQLHGQPFGGRNLVVNEARPRTDFAGSGGGGRGRGRSQRW
jgi:RNA recognition motif-containing protein